MKRISYVLLLGFLSALVLSSCSDEKTYAELLKDEKKLIANFIDRNNIVVVSTNPDPYSLKHDLSLWKKDGKDVYYHNTKSNLYFHMVSYGDYSAPEDSIVSGDQVVTRFLQYTLDEVADTISRLSTTDYTLPITFSYLDYDDVCTGWHEAAGYMKYSGASAKIIVPSKIGFDDYMESVTPLGYDINIKIQKF